MTKRQRLLTNVALSYIVVSALLFSIFVITYRVYFYRIQEQMVITRARQNEKIFLNAVAEALHSAQEVAKVKQETYEENMKWTV
jgi:predicted signal transduction protein with EAL and GGDEF domain